MVTPTPRSVTGLRAVTWEAVRARIADQALMLFDEHGFDATTVDDIAAVVEMSPRSFFRYFPSKEDVVIGDLVAAGGPLRDAVAARLADSAPWDALHLALRAECAAIDADPQRWLRIMRVINSAPSLRARNLEKHLTWSALLIPLVADRVEPASVLADLPARALVGTAFACLDAALTSWTASDGATEFAAALDIAFSAVEHTDGRPAEKPPKR